ncbi:uncharacterized protein LOC134840994 [Symsagittifera roscoffensis]|uniref:uncharacterized protein LOC134840994 n=1 Tax=Symsagittifera roscoffensis TaxID=84072 RepID=UPI00307CA0CC
MKGREIARKGSELEQAGVEELREELAWSKVEVAKLKDVINRAQRDNLSTEGTTAAPLSTANQSKKDNPLNTSTSVDAIFLDREKLPADLDTEQDYFDVVRDNESLKLRNRRLTSEMEKLNTTNKTLHLDLKGMKELENNVKKLELENDKLRDRLRELPIISADTMINEYQEPSKTTDRASNKEHPSQSSGSSPQNRTTSPTADASRITTARGTTEGSDSLKTHLDELARENRRLREEERQRRQEMRAIKTDNANLRTTLTFEEQKDNQIERLQEKSNQLQQECNDMALKLKNMRKQQFEGNSSSEPLLSQMEELTVKCQLLKTANCNLREEIEELKENLLEKDELLKAYEESQLMLDEIAADTNSGDIIEDLQDQVVQFETCNFSLKAEKEAMNDAIKKMGDKLTELGESSSVEVPVDPQFSVVDELKLLIKDNEELRVQNKKMDRELKNLKNFKQVLSSQEELDSDPLRFLENSNQLRRENRKLREQIQKSSDGAPVPIVTADDAVVSQSSADLVVDNAQLKAELKIAKEALRETNVKLAELIFDFTCFRLLVLVTSTFLFRRPKNFKLKMKLSKMNQRN